MDSATVCAIAAKRHYRLHCLTVLYGQRHAREVRSARAIARYFRVERHVVLRLPLAPVLSSALTNRSTRLPERGRRRPAGTIPATYVPARNTILLALALGHAETIGAERIFIGANAFDYPGYPDCRPEFLRQFARLATLATRAGVEQKRRFVIEAPLLRLSKAEIVRRGTRLGVPWADTWSCYAGRRTPCGRCDACYFRAKGFREAGIEDPAATTVAARDYIRSSRSRPR